ncbi:nucleotidyltransferase domain-containing protein [Paenibacillus filicis]|uniref:Nucleotidyltransferase domain-containing protein n=1 Tax=Paenibacillus filicis TaxID=669464 RepID=A0ABU9DJB1_9BACL
MNEIQARIQEELRRIEREEQVRILFACESGSRAWGFPSRDSDYDVRFLYIRTEDSYLSIFEKRDVIERPISDNLDINGWDLKKALNLFRKSNPPLLEWLQSPIRYEENWNVAESIRRLSPFAFSPKSCMYHYLNMAKGNYRDYLRGEQVRIKKYFYVLRPVLACVWIEQFGTMPPIQFEELLKAIVPESSELMQVVCRLLERKKAGEELDMEPAIRPVQNYLEAELERLEQVALQFAGSGNSQDRELDILFRSALREVWETTKT